MARRKFIEKIPDTGDGALSPGEYDEIKVPSFTPAEWERIRQEAHADPEWVAQQRWARKQLDLEK